MSCGMAENKSVEGVENNWVGWRVCSNWWAYSFRSVAQLYRFVNRYFMVIRTRLSSGGLQSTVES